MKKIISLLLLFTFMIGFSTAALAWGRRGQEPDQPAYHLETESPLAGEWTALCFTDDHPVVLAGDESFQFLGPGGQVLKRLPRSRHTRSIFSSGGDFVGVREIAVPGENPGAPRPLTFTLYNREGEKLWSISRPLGSDEPIPGFFLSAKGRVVLVESPESQISFYDDSGKVDRLVQLFPDALWSNERPMACAFSADGERFAVSALHHNPRPGDELSPREKGQSFVILFDGQGEEFWRCELERELPGRVAISPDGRVIVAGGYSVRQMGVVDRSTFLYDWEGNILARLDIPFRLADFSADGSALLLGQKNDLRLVETANGKIRWKKILSGQAGQIRALALSPDGDLALALLARGEYQGPRFVYQAPQAFLYNGQGERIWHDAFPEDNFIQPTAGFLEDGDRFFMAFKDRYLIYAQDK